MRSWGVEELRSWQGDWEKLSETFVVRCQLLVVRCSLSTDGHKWTQMKNKVEELRSLKADKETGRGDWGKLSETFVVGC